MSEYVVDINGVSWKKSAFSAFRLDDESDTIHAWINSRDDEVSAEFEISDWDCPEYTDPIIIPASQPYFCVASWLDTSGKLHHRCHPVIAWLYSDDWVRPITPTDVRDTYPSAILHSNGQVFENEKIWPCIDDYLANRGPDLEERARRSRLVQELQAEMRAEAVKAEPS